MGFVAAQIVSFHAFTMVIWCDPAAPLVVVVDAAVVDAAVDAALVAAAVFLLGFGDALALVRVAPTVIVAGALDGAVTTMAVVDEVPAAEPAAVSLAPNGPAVVSHRAADTAATTAITEANAVRGNLRPCDGLRLLRSMNRSLAILVRST